MAVTTTNLGVITAYGDAVAAGYTGTKAEWQTLMASYATVGQQAVDAKNAAVDAKNAAVQAKDTAVAAKDTATSKATEATTAANTATTKANEASASAQSIAQSASQITQNTSDISELKEDLTQKADATDMLKAFPTDTASGSVASFDDGANVPIKSLIVNIDPVQSGSGDPSPDNVRPISGWSEVNVEHTGKNLFNKASIQNSKWLSTTTGEVENAAASYCVSEYIPVKANEPVHIPNTASSRRWFYDATKTPKTYLSNSSAQTFTPTEDGFIRVTVNIDQSEGVSIDAVQIEYGSSATPYEPYSGQSINIQLGQTVYGGKLDVTNGVLTVDRAIWVVDSDSVRDGSYGMPFSASLPQNVKITNNTYVLSGTICNQLREVTQSSTWGINGTFSRVTGSTGIYFKINNDVTTIESLNEYLALHPMQFCYELATPLTVQLTPHEVRSLLGSNNVWADTGDSAVTYRADPTLYISRLTEPDADMVADANITSGSYFMVGNTLYKATANIASGATIVPNVNCVRKSLSEALNELNA